MLDRPFSSDLFSTDARTSSVKWARRPELESYP